MLSSIVNQVSFVDVTQPGHVAGLSILVYVLYYVVSTHLVTPEVYGRHRFKQTKYQQGSKERKKLDRYRASAGNFPPPFANGWYMLAHSKDVPAGKVLTIQALGREILLWRGKENGPVTVSDATCPHLGTHLGFGGQINKDGNLVCPYHQWEFDGEGNNKGIPYCPKDMSGSERVKLKTYHSLESKELGEIFLWFHSEGGPPKWPLHPGLTDIEANIKDGSMRRICDTEFDKMLMHVFEPSQNSADVQHFQTVHQYLPMPFNLKLVKADHLIKAVYGDGGEIPMDCLLIRERLMSLKLFGRISLPQWIPDCIVTYVHIQGPTNVVFRVDTPLGRFRAHFSLLTEEAFEQKARMVMYADKHMPWFLARLLHWWIEETVGQDRQVWEHKNHMAPRNLVVGDGPAYTQFGKWLDRFYTEKSMSWDDYNHNKTQTLEW